MTAVDQMALLRKRQQEILSRSRERGDNLLTTKEMFEVAMIDLEIARLEDLSQ